MSSRETQKIILDAAIELFNEHGSANISTNRVAEHCGISKGNLNYHFRVKAEIIIAIFGRITCEMNADWYDDHLMPTLDHMAHMFNRQLDIIWRYRFFYRELVSLLREDELLRRRFQEQRLRRRAEVKRFMEGLTSRGYLQFGSSDDLDHLITATWVLSDHWLVYVESTGRTVDAGAFRWGYDVLINMIKPYFTDLARSELQGPAPVGVVA